MGRVVDFFDLAQGFSVKRQNIVKPRHDLQPTILLIIHGVNLRFRH
jgi:hypothetical protein